MKSYLFRVELIKEEDGRWSAGVHALPGYATWGDTKEDALRNIHDAVEAYIRDMRKTAEEIPEDPTTQTVDEPVVAVSV